MAKDYYKELDKAISSYEEHRLCHQYSTSWISDKICWCWKFRHITEEQLDELTSRMIDIFEEKYR